MDTAQTLARIADLHRELSDSYRLLAEQQVQPARPHEPERLLSATEIAPMLGTTVDHVWSMMRQGVLPTVYVGKKYRRVSLAAVQAYMSGRPVPVQAKTGGKRTPRIGRREPRDLVA
jgi:excisionase family DNA binding protein